MINLAKVSLKKINQARSLVKSGYFKHPFIENAPDEIARLQGMTNFDELATRYSYLVKLPNCPPLLKHNIKNFGFRPYNYARIPCDYLGVEITLHLLEIKHKNAILQLASNYGPFLFYLSQEFGFNNVYGLDIDPFAARYAKRIGNNVILSQAHCLPIADSTFDVVFSQNFIDFEYLRFAYGNDLLCLDYNITRIMSEIYRVLRPGGIFISSQEVFSVRMDQKLWGLFEKRHAFSEQINNNSVTLSRICVFEKA